MEKNKSEKSEEDEEDEDMPFDLAYYYILIFIGLSTTIFCFNRILQLIIPICYYLKKKRFNEVLDKSIYKIKTSLLPVRGRWRRSKEEHLAAVLLKGK